MAFTLFNYLESCMPQWPLASCFGAACSRLCCLSSRRKGSETFDDDFNFPITGPLQQPTFEEDPLWQHLRRIPGFMLWSTFIATALLPISYPTVLAWICFFAMCNNLITLSFHLLWTYQGFKKIEASMMNPVRIPALIEQSAGLTSSSTSEGGSGQAGTRAERSAAVDDVIQAAQVLHLVAICRCTEPIECLEETIDHLSTHSNKEMYIILLCLEAKDKHAAAVGETLVRKYAGVFNRVMYAIHPGGLATEVPGKSANVAWGARAAYSSLEQDLGARALDRLVITVADCDAKVSEHYFNELSVRFAAAAREKREVFWAPPMLFDAGAAEGASDPTPSSGEGGTSMFKTDLVESLLGRGGKQLAKAFFGGAIPAPVQLADKVWSMFVLQNLVGSNWVHLPCSTYSVGMRLIASVGFWDTGVESVPEDYHTALKLYWGTSGRARCEPIMHPVLYQHIDGGGGWFSTVYQRFEQGCRHMWGATDVAYIMWLMLKSSNIVPFAARLRIIITVFDVHVNCSICSFFATFAYASFTFWRPGWLLTPVGHPFLIYHEAMVILMLVLSMGIGAVYEWFAREMVAANMRPQYFDEVQVGSTLGLTLGLPSSQPSSPSREGASMMMSRSPNTPTECASPGQQVGEGDREGAGNAPGGATDKVGEGSQDASTFVTIDDGPATGSSAGYASPSRGGGNDIGWHARDRANSAILPRGQILVKDRSVLASLATCTASSVWEYILALLPWLWTAPGAFVYLLAPAANAQTRLIFVNRMRPHVSGKSVPTPSATPRQPGTSTPTLRMPNSASAADVLAWDGSGSRTPTGGNTPQLGAVGRSVRLQLPNAAFSGPRNPSSGQFSSLPGNGSNVSTPVARYSGTEQRGEGGQGSGHGGAHRASGTWA